jgi:hypothetical protein
MILKLSILSLKGALKMLRYSLVEYRALKERLQSELPELDEITLADTLEGLTDLHEIISAIVRSALSNEALSDGLKLRLKEMHERAQRLDERAAKCRGIAKDAMLDAGIKQIIAPDFTISLRHGSPSVVVTQESAIPATYFRPQPAKLDRIALLSALKAGAQVPGAELSNSQPVLNVRVG